jgi:hypothetical protein
MIDEERRRELDKLVAEMNLVMLNGHAQVEAIKRELPMLFIAAFTAGIVVGVCLTRLVHG